MAVEERDGVERQRDGDAEVIGRLPGGLGDVEADVGQAQLLLGQAGPLVAEDERDAGFRRVLPDAGDGLGQADQREVMADPGRRSEDEIAVRDGRRERREEPGRFDDRRGMDGRAPGGRLEAVEADDPEVGEPRVGHAPSGQPAVLRAVGTDQDDGQPRSARGSAHGSDYSGGGRLAEAPGIPLTSAE